MFACNKISMTHKFQHVYIKSTATYTVSKFYSKRYLLYGDVLTKILAITHFDLSKKIFY